jgi:hypothetical protein
MLLSLQRRIRTGFNSRARLARLALLSSGRLDFGDPKGAVCSLGRELDLVAFLNLVEHGRILHV